MNKISVILALSFGKPATAGGNRLTARWAEKISQDKIPIVSDSSVPLKSKANCYFVGSKNPADHISTPVLVKEFYDLAKEKKWNSVLVVCAPDYSNRVARDVRIIFKKHKQGIKINTWSFRRESNALWYDKKSTQFWTRYRFLFKIYEQILMSMPFIVYKKLTKICS